MPGLFTPAGLSSTALGGNTVAGGTRTNLLPAAPGTGPLMRPLNFGGTVNPSAPGVGLRVGGPNASPDLTGTSGMSVFGQNHFASPLTPPRGGYFDRSSGGGGAGGGGGGTGVAPPGGFFGNRESFSGGGNSQSGWTGARDANGRPVMASAGAHGLGGGFTPPAPNIDPGMGGVSDLYNLQKPNYVDPVSGQIMTHGTADHSIFNDPGFKAQQAQLADAPNAAGHSWNTTDQGAPITARAGGGDIQAGEPTLVGENGPEVVVPQQDGHVFPNVAGNAMAAGLSTAGQGLPSNPSGFTPAPSPGPPTGFSDTAKAYLNSAEPPITGAGVSGQLGPGLSESATRQMPPIQTPPPLGGAGGAPPPNPTPAGAGLDAATQKRIADLERQVKHGPDTNSSPLDIYRVAAGTVDPNTGENFLSPGNNLADPGTAVARLNSLPFAQRAAIQQRMATPDGRNWLQQQEMGIVSLQNSKAMEAWKEGQTNQRWSDREDATMDRTQKQIQAAQGRADSLESRQSASAIAGQMGRLGALTASDVAPNVVKGWQDAIDKVGKMQPDPDDPTAQAKAYAKIAAEMKGHIDVAEKNAGPQWKDMGNGTFVPTSRTGAPIARQNIYKATPVFPASDPNFGPPTTGNAMTPLQPSAAERNLQIVTHPVYGVDANGKQIVTGHKSYKVEKDASLTPMKINGDEQEPDNVSKYAPK